jgi:hypothetical protein
MDVCDKLLVREFWRDSEKGLMFEVVSVSHARQYGSEKHDR